MAKQLSSVSGQPHRELRPARTHRHYLWGLASWLKNGGIVTAFYLAWHAGRMGTWALAAFLSGVLLKQLLEATSAGD